MSIYRVAGTTGNLCSRTVYPISVGIVACVLPELRAHEHIPAHVGNLRHLKGNLPAAHLYLTTELSQLGVGLQWNAVDFSLLGFYVIAQT